MARPRVTVVGLGPGDAEYLTQGTIAAIESAANVRFRTGQHPAASQFPDVTTYDEWYESAASFDDLYDRIVEDLIHLAATTPVVYAVPGSPLVAEATVERLLARSDVEVTILPAVSTIDVACAALRIDPMSASLQVIDALDVNQPLQGSGSFLVLQTYSPEVMAAVADRLDDDTRVCVVFHAGLPEQDLRWMTAKDLGRVPEADHLTSLFIPAVHDVGSAVGDLVSLMEILRKECAWDQEQTHTSLARHLIEEAYEVIDALERYSKALDGDGDIDAAAHHVEEELGDLLFQIVFHSHLGREHDTFSLTTVADAVHRKLVARHPHVFGDVTVASADDAEARWETLKKAEKNRESVTDGIAWELPGLVLHAKLLRKAASVGISTMDAAAARERAHAALASLSPDDDEAWRDIIESLSVLAKTGGVDLEGIARSLALSLRDEIVAVEGLANS